MNQPIEIEYLLKQTLKNDAHSKNNSVILRKAYSLTLVQNNYESSIK